jgi:hypothetical protein
VSLFGRALSFLVYDVLPSRGAATTVALVRGALEWDFKLLALMSQPGKALMT